MFLEGPTRKEISAEDLLEEVDWKMSQAPHPAIGASRQDVVSIVPNPGTELYFRYGGKDFLLRRVELILKVSNFRETVLVEKLHQYAGDGKVLAYAGQGKVTTGLERPIDFVILKKADSDRITVMARPLPWWKRKRKKRR